MGFIGDYRLDIFDTYNFLIISPFAFFASLVLIVAQLTNSQLLRQPGDLIFMVSISELFLSLYYFSMGLRTKYITSTVREVSPFCRFNSWVVNIFGTLEYLYALCLMCHLFFTLKSAIQKSFVPKKLYHFFNIAVTVAVNFFYVNGASLGKTPYGMCGTRVGSVGDRGQTEGLLKDLWLGALSVLFGVGLGIFVLVYTIRTLPNFGKELNELKRDFMNYYRAYIQACILIWVVIFASHLAQMIGEDQSREVEERQDWLGVIFSLGRVGNTAKVLMPLVLFFIRIQDPLIRKNIWSPWSKVARRMSLIEPSEEFTRRSTRAATIKSSKTTRETNLTEALDTSKLDEAGNMADMVEEETDDLMWMNLLPTKIKESYTRTFLACIFNKYPKKLEEKKGVSCSTKEDTQDVIMYDIKGAHLMKKLNTQKSIIDCRFTIYCPAAFRDIIESSFKPVDIRSSLDISLNEEKIRKAGESGGGASGELFMFSHDNQLILKTANNGEVEVFKDLLLDYKEHMRLNKRTQISKIFGLFDFTFNGSDKSIKLILMENLFTLNNDCILRKYDMKGSKHSRKVLKHYHDLAPNSKVDKIMKDLDFLEIDKTLDLHAGLLNDMLKTIENDVDFFQAHQIIDYSIILAVVGPLHPDRQDRRGPGVPRKRAGQEPAPAAVLHRR